MKKKIVSLVLCTFIVVLALSACGKEKEDAGETIEQVEQSEEQQLEETEEEVEEEAEKTVEEDKDEVVPGSSQTNAYLLPLNTKVFGTVDADEYAWFAFTTGEEAGATYNVTFVNETVESGRLKGTVIDEYGTAMEGYECAERDGFPMTISSASLEPDTTYYVRLESENDDKLDYSLIIKNPEDKQTAYKTLGTFSDAVGAVVKDGDTVTAGTNINDAIVLPLEAKVHGTVSGKKAAWFSFTTGDNEGATYHITFVNDSPSSGRLFGINVDEYGTRWEESYAKESADDDGTPMTLTLTSLEPDTTYYVELFSENGNMLDYSLMVKSPDANKQESNLIFETPFEINDTQVQFVAEKAVFIDEAQAKEVLKPVAEAILEHPERSVLLAGTTATDGEQAARVQLSNKRAEAVKQLLVTVYKVPESQIKTVGLGFEADPFERGKDRDANGNFVESEGRKNRRVVVLDTEDPVAQEILKR